MVGGATDEGGSLAGHRQRPRRWPLPGLWWGQPVGRRKRRRGGVQPLTEARQVRPPPHGVLDAFCKIHRLHAHRDTPEAFVEPRSTVVADNHTETQTLVPRGQEALRGLADQQPAESASTFFTHHVQRLEPWLG